MRLFAFADDPKSSTGGTKYEDLQSAGTIPPPTTFVPVTTANADPGLQQLERTDEVRGRRGNTAPVSFASAPTLPFEARAYPKLLRPILRKALGSAITSTGTVPAAVTSTVGPLQSGNLPSIVGWLLREGQLDRVTGAVVSEFELNFPIEEEGTISVTLNALYHDTDDSTAAKDPAGTAAVAIPAADYSSYDDETFKLRDAKAFVGATPVELPDLAGFGLTFNNGLIDDFRSRFRPGHNIASTVIDTVEHRLWYPNRHKLGAQTVTGRIDFSDVQPAREIRRLFAHAEKLVFEVAAGKLGTNPPVDEMLRITIYKHVLTGGGAEPLQKEGDQVATYEFGGYVDSASNKDIEVSFVGAAALT